ncbi:hypothetical protein GS438_06535 [Rhodococcus hoagii]|nr:hypothetical protein [Prescottella equi]
MRWPGCGPTALAGLVETDEVKADRTQRRDRLPQTALKGPARSSAKIPQWSNTLERNRARTYFQRTRRRWRCTSPARRCRDQRRADQDVETFEVPDEGIGCGFTEAVRGVLSHHMVIRDGKIANYHPYPPTPWNASPRDAEGVPGPYEDAVTNLNIYEENDRDHFRASTSCAPCAASTRACPAVSTCTSATQDPRKTHSPTQSMTGE